MILVVTACAAQASVVYSFAGTGDAFSTVPAEPEAFQLAVPKFLAPPPNGSITFSCAQLDSSTNCNVASGPFAVYFSNFPSNSLGAADTLEFVATNDIAYLFDFMNGAFGAPGVYVALQGNSGTLTVTETPEPVTGLFALGVVCLFGLRRLVAKACLN